MRSIDKIDLPRRLSPVLPVWAGELITALICLAATGLARVVMDALLPGVAPFVLLFPACLAATLVGGWRPGLITLLVLELVAWAYVIPPRGLFFKGEAHPANLVAVLFAGALVVAVAQLFRNNARQAAAEGDAKIAERELMLRELEHRSSNNFQAVAAMIGLQLRRSRDEPARNALREALERVTSLSRAQRNLSVSVATAPAVEMDVYLPELCASLAQALFLGELVRLECDVERTALDRDRAVAVGLIVNELVTNAAKHAFADGAGGRIRVAFARQPGGFRLTVEDDGRGLPADFGARRQGLGRGLVEAFTRQAGGSLTVGGGPGARFDVDLAA